MESVRSRRCRETMSPERLIRSMNHQEEEEVSNRSKTPIFRRFQVVYYLTRNGHLEHPHFMEVISPINHPLRLRDVINRLMILRGKSMPLLYSWSCKRSYRNGFVWNDLAENDVIYPSDCAEYVLKGSELAEKFQDVHVNKSLSGPIQEPPKSQLLRSKPNRRNKTASFDDSELYVGEEEEDGEYELYEEKTSYTSSTTPQSRSSRGISTETIELTGKRQQKHQHNVIKTIQRSLPVKSDSSELTRPNSPELTRSDPVMAVGDVLKRVEDGDPVYPGSGRSGSVFLQMISCGHIVSKYAPSLKSRQKEENLRKGVLCKNVVKKAVVEDEREMIKFMSENPRFGNPQAEEKEYFSGSIVEAMSQERVTAEPGLRRSNSFNEERSKIMETDKEMMKNKEEKVMVKVKCIPRRKSSSCLMAPKK